MLSLIIMNTLPVGVRKCLNKLYTYFKLIGEGRNIYEHNIMSYLLVNSWYSLRLSLNMIIFFISFLSQFLVIFLITYSLESDIAILSHCVHLLTVIPPIPVPAPNSSTFFPLNNWLFIITNRDNTILDYHNFSPLRPCGNIATSPIDRLNLYP